MLTESARRRLCVVLVGARNPQNIGAAARAMQDLGFHHLRVVNEFAPPFEAAQLEAKSAVGAEEIMRSARLFSSLSEAIADCGLVVGTTAIGERALPLPVEPLKTVASRIRAALTGEGDVSSSNAAEALPAPSEATGSVVALLFGSEKTGLTREQLSYCSALLTIPLYQPEGRHLSMNLGQAVAICLYELSREGFEGARALPVHTTATASMQERERLLSLLQEAMQLSDYARRFPANARPAVVRQLVHGLAGSPEIAATWMGVLKLVIRRMGGTPSS